MKMFLSENDYLQTPKTNKQLFTAITDWRVVLYKLILNLYNLLKHVRLEINKDSTY